MPEISGLLALNRKFSGEQCLEARIHQAWMKAVFPRDCVLQRQLDLHPRFVLSQMYLLNALKCRTIVEAGIFFKIR